MKKKVVIFGGSGFLGSFVVDELCEALYEVTVVDIKKPKNNSVTYICKDVLSDIDVNFHEYDYVFNFIAQPDIHQSKEKVEFTFNLNVMLNIRILENRLDKVMIKYNEAQSIKKTYE